MEIKKELQCRKQNQNCTDSQVRSREMTGRTQTVPEVRRSKDDRKQNTLAPLLTHIQKVQCTDARRRCGRARGLRAGGRGQEYPQI